jgi:hypothetical protein
VKGTTILQDPLGFKTFELAHRIEHGEHHFEVAYGSSFSEFYYDFTPQSFRVSANCQELLHQFARAGLSWLPAVLDQLASGNARYTTAQLGKLATGIEQG